MGRGLCTYRCLREQRGIGLAYLQKVQRLRREAYDIVEDWRDVKGVLKVDGNLDSI